MASLVQFLASGVNGAEQGTATFVLRGTASSAASVLYSDFEETTQPGTNIITLDANGAAEIYCDAYCDVTLKTVGGSTLRTVTIGHAATMVEVQSDSFTGTGYTGSPTASGQPITLAAVLDKWDNSAGADDWKVAVNGVATNLSSAFSALAGLFFNVKDPTYGAVGDGVTDDTTAIGLAITAAAAAGGGIVFFPASTSFYKFTTLSISAANFTLMGAGSSASVLKSSTTSADAITFSDSTAGSKKRVIGLGLQGTGANSNNFIALGSCPEILFDSCNINFSTYSGVGIKTTSSSSARVFSFKDTTITGSASNTSVLNNNSSSDNTTYFYLRNCTLSVPVSFTGNILLGPNFVATQCYFDGSAVTSGVYRHINATSNATAGKYLGKFTENTFVDGGSTGFAFQLTGISSSSDLIEDNNTFVGFTAPSALTSAGQIYNVSHNSENDYRVLLGSRRGRTLSVTHASTGTVVLSAMTAFENLYINYTAAGNLTIQMPNSTMTNGSETNLVLQNNNGTNRDITIDYGESPKVYGPLQATTGSDLTVTLNGAGAERLVAKVFFMHFSSGAPLAFIPSPVSD